MDNDRPKPYLRVDLEITDEELVKYDKMAVAAVLLALSEVPGVSVRAISSKERDNFTTCEQCLGGRGKFRMVILKDHIWKKIAEKHEFLCAGCIEERLGRKLTMQDMKPCGITDDLLWARELRLRPRK